MKVLAKDAKAGQWYEDKNGARCLCIGSCSLAYTPSGCVYHSNGDLELIHLPGCTSWDWKPQKPKPKYRAFANAAEFLNELRMRHSCDRYYRHNSETRDVHQPIGRFHDNALDGEPWDLLLAEYVWCDGSPFGVEVTE